MTGRSGSQGTEQESNPPADAAESVPGYRELARIGQGGFSVVYRAVQESFERSVALKVLADAGVDEDARRRFLREVRLASRLSGHPHVVTVLDTGTTRSGRPYLAMDLYEGGSMKERLKREGPLSPAETAVVGAKIADALAAAHALGVLHRDVKPNNILVSRFGEPALADFGVSVLLDSSSSASVLDVFSPQHAAPELMTRGVPSPSSDVYALGSTLYELLTGHSPFAGESRDVRAIMWAAMSEPAPRPDCPDLPELADVIVRALAKEPEDRFEDAAEFARTLRALIPDGTPATLPMPDLAPTMLVGAADLDLDLAANSLYASAPASDPDETGGRAASNAALVADATSAGLLQGSDETMFRPDRADPAAGTSATGSRDGRRRARKPLVLLLALALLGTLGWAVYESQGPSTGAATDDASAHHVLPAASPTAKPTKSAARSTSSATPTATYRATTTTITETSAAVVKSTTAAPSTGAATSASATSSSSNSGFSLSSYYRLLNAQSGDCLTNPAAQSACASTESEGWEYTDALTGILSGVVAGQFELVNKQSGDCLTAGDGGQVSAQACDGGTAQLWSKVSAGGNDDELQNAEDGLCLQSSGGSVVDGTCNASDKADLWSEDGTV